MKFITQTVLISQLAISAKILVNNEICKVGPNHSIIDSRKNIFISAKDKFNKPVDCEVDFIRLIIHDDTI